MYWPTYNDGTIIWNQFQIVNVPFLHTTMHLLYMWTGLDPLKILVVSFTLQSIVSCLTTY